MDDPGPPGNKRARGPRKRGEIAPPLADSRLRLIEQNERRFLDIAQAAGAWFWETDADNRFVWMSDAVERVTGVSPEWHYGKRRDEIAAAFSDLGAEPWKSHLEAITRQEAFRDFRYPRAGPDKDQWLSSSGAPFYGPAGEFLGYRGIGSDITHVVELEARLRLADERVRLVIEHLNEPMCLTDPAGRIVMCNRAFRQINANVEEWLVPGCRFEDQLRAGLPLGNFPDAVGREDQWLQERLAQRALGGGPHEIRRQNGNVILVYDQKFDDGSILTFSLDITDRVRAETLLKEQLNFASQLLEAIPSPVFYKDAQGRYLGCNRAFETYIGRPREELIGMSVFDLSPRDLAERYAAADQVLFDRPGTQVYEASVQHADGTRHEVVFSKATFRRVDGGVGGLVGVILDVTAVKRAEASLQELNQTLENRVAVRTTELQAMVRELEAFSYSMAHDLRTPLGVISSFSHLLGRDEAARLSAEGRRMLQLIEGNVAHLVTLVDALLALAQVSRVRLQRKPIDLGQIAAQAAKGLSVLYPRAEIVLGALPQASGDPALVAQALSNLMDNALKYSSRDAAPRVSVGWNQNAQACFVRDNGIGFEMQHADKLFGAFERLHADTEFPGSGIGLAIVKRVIERHGGRVWAEAAPGRGATFYFTLGDQAATREPLAQSPGATPP